MNDKEIIAGYGEVPDYDHCTCDDESITHTLIDDCVHDNLNEITNQVAIKDWPEVLDVDLFVDREITPEDIERFAVRVIEDLVEILDEDDDYSRPDPHEIHPTNLAEIEAAAITFVALVLRDRKKNVDFVKTIQVNVLDWVKANEPTWITEADHV